MKRFLISAILTAAVSSSVVAADQPSFPGGEKALQEYIDSNMQYPAAAIQNGIEGVVNVECTIKSDGSVGTIKIVRMIDPDLEQEAIRLVKNMPAWSPATKDGAAVEATGTVPVTFSLPE